MTATSKTWQRRRQTGGAAALCLTVLLAACGPFLPPATPTVTPPSLAPASTISGTPAERLIAALTALQGGYTFDTVVRVGDKQAAHVVGRWYRGASELSIESSGATVTYRIISQNAWVEQDPGIWVEADPATTTASGDPLRPLLAPVAVDAVAGSTSADQLVATYPAASLGLAGPDPVSVVISIAADGSIAARYEAETATGLATSETVLKPAPGQEPILAPSPLPSAGG